MMKGKFIGAKNGMNILCVIVALAMVMQLGVLSAMAEDPPQEDAVIETETEFETENENDENDDQLTVGESGAEELPDEPVDEPADEPADGPVDGPAEQPQGPIGDYYQAIAANLEDDEYAAFFWGWLQEGITMEMFDPSNGEQLPEISALSELDPEHDISGKVTVTPEVWINGTKYTEFNENTNIVVKKGDSFSWKFNWSISTESDETLHKEDHFKKQIFKIPGLNLPKRENLSMVIQGIKIGTYSLIYDNQTGEMVFSAQFNEFAAYFSNIAGMFKGSGKFTTVITDEDITLGGETSGVGGITVEEVPAPEKPPEGGVGWAPTPPPTFNNKVYNFGKGYKWNSSSNSERPPQMEWRVVFLNHLQDVQSKYINEANFNFPETEYCIIEEELDVNQKFSPLIGSNGEPENLYSGGESFYFEVPVVVPGTGEVLNQSGSATGDGNYNGPGIISTVIKGDKFTPLKSEDEVKATPLSWTIVESETPKRQKLVINVGKLGTTNDGEGLTYSKTGGAWSNIDGEIEKLIEKCDTQIEALGKGTDSPLATFDTRNSNMIPVVTNVLNVPANKDKKEEAEEIIARYNAAYAAWLLTVEPTQPIVNRPDITELKNLETLVTHDGNKLSDKKEYKDWLKSYENLIDDQGKYVSNIQTYIASWENAKTQYENTRKFYNGGRIYGFVLKVCSESVNVSATSYNNSAKLYWGDTSFDASSDYKVTFDQNITGNYQAGSIVMQKADSSYDTGKDDQADISSTGANGLIGAKFEVYCGEHDDVEFDQSGKKLAHFWPKGASENGDTYVYVHSGQQDKPIDDVHELEVNNDGEDKGRLILGNMNLGHPHWLVETAAPEGYYLDSTPIKLTSSAHSVIYKMLPNVSRAVLLKKVDSRTDKPVAGAEFKLTKLVYGTNPNPNPANEVSFISREINGVTVYVPARGSQPTVPLVTNADGELRIHDLDEGKYYLTEVGAPGYEPPAEESNTYVIELNKDLHADYKNILTEKDGFYYLNLTKDKPLENDPKTTYVTLNKRCSSQAPLGGAVFALLEWEGSEAEWVKNPGALDKWKVVDLTTNGSPYFNVKAGTIKTNVEVPLALQALIGGEKVKGVATTAVDASGDGGQLTISELPIGHYILVEVQAPASYQQNDQLFYFDVDSKNVEDTNGVKLYRNVRDSDPVAGNIVYNFAHPAKFVLVKYAEDQTPPDIDGEKMNDGDNWNERDDGWKYEGAEITGQGLGGVGYKLFVQLGKTPNPEKAELARDKANTFAVTYSDSNKPTSDPCVAYGSTDEKGILSWDTMTKYRKDLDWKDKGLPLGNYYLVEVAEPENYLLDQTPILLPLDARTIITKPTDGDNSDNGDNEHKYEPGLIKLVSNKKVDYALELTKYDMGSDNELNEGDKPLAGAVFEIYKAVPSNGTTEKGQPIKVTGSDGVYTVAAEGAEGAEGAVTEMKTDDNGVLKVRELKKGAYAITEVKAPQGFEKLKEPIVVNITGDGKVDETNVIWTKTAVGNKRRLGSALLIKKDFSTQSVLAGAEFQLYTRSYEEITKDDREYEEEGENKRLVLTPYDDPVTSDENGRVAFNDLPWNEYAVKETKAPEGYLLSDSILEFNIEEHSFSQDGEPTVITFGGVYNIKGEMGKVKLTKVEADTNKPLAGAEFALYRKLPNAAGESENWVKYGEHIYVTDENGEINIDLHMGEYYLIETKAPNGYLLGEPKPIFFTITDTAEDNEANKGMNIELGPIENKIDPNATGTVKLTKTDEDDPTKLLPGARFRLYKKADDGQWHPYSELSYVTDSNGVIVFEMLPFGTYCFREVAAPDGYYSDSGREYQFIIDEVGKVVSLTVTNRRETTPGGYEPDGGTDREDPDDENSGTDSGYNDWKRSEITDKKDKDGSTFAEGAYEDEADPSYRPTDIKDLPMTGANWLLVLLMAAGGAAMILFGIYGKKK